MVLVVTLKVELHIVTKTVFALNFFSDINLPKFKPILLDILYSLPDESNFFTETGVLDKQECYKNVRLTYESIP